MSDLHIALVAEGDTDYIIIEAALKAILPKPFVLTLLQPENTQPALGGGWCGVLKWCRQFHESGFAALENDPTLALFDLFIIHLDADVAYMAYADCGPATAQAASVLPALPCFRPCPPVIDTTEQLTTLLLGWLGLQQPGAKTVFCIPSLSSESWLAAALLPDGHDLLTNLECRLNLADSLSQLPKKQRIRKSTCEYRPKALAITQQWHKVCDLCSQAKAFDYAALSLLLTP